jgi:hypothetical protein
MEASVAFLDDYLNGAMPNQMPVAQIDPSQLPDVPARRGIGNVLSDFFSAEQQAKRRPLSNAVGNIGDFLSSIAQISRGETPTMLHRTLYNANTDRMQQQADIERQNQARNAFAQIFQSADPRISALAKFDPQTAWTVQNQLAEQQAAAQKPQVFGNTIIPRTPGGGYDIEHAKSFGYDYQPVTVGDQPGVIDKRTGHFIPQGTPKRQPLVYKETANGQIAAIDPSTGKVVNTIGPVKEPKGTAASKVDPSGALASLSNIQQGFNDLRDLKALPGQGDDLLSRAEGALGRTGIGQHIGEQFGSPAAQKRLEIGKNVSALQQEMIKSLPASATRSRFEQELIQRGLPDPAKMDYNTAKTVIGQLRQSYLKAVKDASAETAGQTNTQVQPQADLPKVGEVQSGYRYKGGNPANQASWEKVQ